MFLKIFFTSGFITSTASENRFSLAVFLTQPPVKIPLPVLSYPTVKMMIFTGPSTDGSKKRQ
jgi:hypothetical protein